MDVGQVGYHDTKLEHFAHNVPKDKLLLKKIQKTMKEEFPDLKAVYEQRLQSEKSQR